MMCGASERPPVNGEAAGRRIGSLTVMHGQEWWGSPVLRQHCCVPQCNPAPMDSSERAVIAWCVPVIDSGICADQEFLTLGLQILPCLQLTLTSKTPSLLSDPSYSNEARWESWGTSRCCDWQHIGWAPLAVGTGCCFVESKYVLILLKPERDKYIFTIFFGISLLWCETKPHLQFNILYWH